MRRDLASQVNAAILAYQVRLDCVLSPSLLSLYFSLSLVLSNFLSLSLCVLDADLVPGAPVILWACKHAADAGVDAEGARQPGPSAARAAPDVARLASSQGDVCLSSAESRIQT